MLVLRYSTVEGLGCVVVAFKLQVKKVGRHTTRNSVTKMLTKDCLKLEDFKSIRL